MAKTVLNILIVLIMVVLFGCGPIDTGRSQLVTETKEFPIVVEATDESESDIIERIAVNRREYQDGLESLVAHYSSIGNNMKLNWAKSELQELMKMPKYNYIVEAVIAGPDLKASTSIKMADFTFKDARNIEIAARDLLNNEDRLREALGQYNELIRTYPKSDKIDDAAFYAAGIYESFRDYTLALLYYQRAYQWDPKTPHPARYKSAYILDRYLHRRLEAVELFNEALEKERLSSTSREYAQKRIDKLTKSDETLGEPK